MYGNLGRNTQRLRVRRGGQRCTNKTTPMSKSEYQIYKGDMPINFEYYIRQGRGTEKDGFKKMKVRQRLTQGSVIRGTNNGKPYEQEIFSEESQIQYAAYRRNIELMRDKGLIYK